MSALEQSGGLHSALPSWRTKHGRLVAGQSLDRQPHNTKSSSASDGEIAGHASAGLAARPTQPVAAFRETVSGRIGARAKADSDLRGLSPQLPNNMTVAKRTIAAACSSGFALADHRAGNPWMLIVSGPRFCNPSSRQSEAMTATIGPPVSLRFFPAPWQRPRKGSCIPHLSMLPAESLPRATS